MNNIAILPGIAKKEIIALRFWDKKENLILLGEVGLYKSHLELLCLYGLPARYAYRSFTAASLANILLERNNKNVCSKAFL